MDLPSTPGSEQVPDLRRFLLIVGHVISKKQCSDAEKDGNWIAFAADVKTDQFCVSFAAKPVQTTFDTNPRTFGTALRHCPRLGSVAWSSQVKVLLLHTAVGE